LDAASLAHLARQPNRENERGAAEGAALALVGEQVGYAVTACCAACGRPSGVGGNPAHHDRDWQVGILLQRQIGRLLTLCSRN
jgi:hypothetical protein